MKLKRGRWTWSGTAALAGAAFWGLAVSAAAAPATQTIDARDLLLRLQRLERDMHDVQAETFRKNPGAQTQAPGAAAAMPEPAPEVQPAPVMPDLNPLIRRIDELEETLGRLTGQMEELGHQVDQVSQKTDRLQKQMDFQAQQAQQGMVAAGAPPMPSDMAAMAAAPAPGDAVASLTSDQAPPTRGTPPANLGQIPANTRLPTATARPPDAKGQYDAAMTLLASAQYDKARDAFRKFADDHPDEDKASDALYWTGDIAYSAKDYDEAAHDFAELLKKYPKAQRAPEGMLQLGLALFQLGQMKEGCAALAALPAKYPDASQAVATRARAERTGAKCK